MRGGYGIEGKLAIRFVLANDATDPDDHALALARLMDALMNLCSDQIKRYKGRIPLLYTSGVRYQQEPRGIEDWQDCLTTLERGHGDCEDLCGYRGGELRAAGIWATPLVTWVVMPDGHIEYHIQIVYPDGKIECPSRVLGMQ